MFTACCFWLTERKENAEKKTELYNQRQLKNKKRTFTIYKSITTKLKIAY